jgi:hypothetical protein
VIFPNLGSGEINIHTSHPANYETQLIERDILDMLKCRMECGAAPMRLKRSPRLKTYEGKGRELRVSGPVLWCQFELVEDMTNAIGVDREQYFSRLT